jgi:hypothetical protein
MENSITTSTFPLEDFLLQQQQEDHHVGPTGPTATSQEALQYQPKQEWRNHTGYCHNNQPNW